MIVGDFKEFPNEIVHHSDEEDIIPCILIVHDPLHGGESLYFNGIKKATISEIKSSIPIHHCRLQIGAYNKVLHSASWWIGDGSTMNFNLRRKIIELI